MNLCFESCQIFNQLLIENSGNLKQTFIQCQNRRKKDTDAMATIALNHFNNLLHSNRFNHNIRWDLSRFLGKHFDQKWMDEYEMVAFSHMPLSQVYDKIQQQNKILDKATHSVKQLFA